MKNSNCCKILNKHYIIAFWITLGVALGLIIGGFLVPPRGIIDGSILTATGIIFLWPVLAFGARAVESGRVAKLNFGNNSVSIGQDSNGNGLDDTYEKELENEQIDTDSKQLYD